jgi:drug/metabolite transporter (DMT)-like permease
MIHHGQLAFGTKNSALRAFLFVGAAYFLIAGLTLAYLVLSKSEPLQLTRQGVTLSTVAGILGAFGALGIVFAIKSGGTPLAVAPLVFAGAPVVNTLVSMLWDKPTKPPSVMFYFGIVLACVGAAIVLRFKPA